MNIFTPKKIIFDTIKRKLEGTGIVKLVLVFNVKTEKYNIMLSKEDNSHLKLDIEENEMNMVKRMFISKIQRKYEKESTKEIKCLILQMDFPTEDIKIFVEDISGEVELFNY